MRTTANRLDEVAFVAALARSILLLEVWHGEITRHLAQDVPLVAVRSSGWSCCTSGFDPWKARSVFSVFAVGDVDHRRLSAVDLF